jgi:integrase
MCSSAPELEPDLATWPCTTCCSRSNKAVTVHGFRSTFRDWAAEATSYPNHVVEQALAHTIGNAVEAAYRRGDLFDKRRHLMNDWAAFCEPPAANLVVALNSVSR